MSTLLTLLTPATNAVNRKVAAETADSGGDQDFARALLDAQADTFQGAELLDTGSQGAESLGAEHDGDQISAELHAELAGHLTSGHAVPEAHQSSDSPASEGDALPSTEEHPAGEVAVPQISEDALQRDHHLRPETDTATEPSSSGEDAEPQAPEQESPKQESPAQESAELQAPQPQRRDGQAPEAPETADQTSAGDQTSQGEEQSSAAAQPAQDQTQDDAESQPPQQAEQRNDSAPRAQEQAEQQKDGDTGRSEGENPSEQDTPAAAQDETAQHEKGQVEIASETVPESQAKERSAGTAAVASAPSTPVPANAPTPQPASAAQQAPAAAVPAAEIAAVEGAKTAHAAAPAESAVAAATVSPPPAAQPASLAGIAPEAPVGSARSVPLNLQLSGPVHQLSASGAGEKTLTVNVAPESLGPVTVKANITANGVRIELFAPQDAGREALRAMLTDLRRDLVGLGMSTGSTTLTVSDGEATSTPNSSTFQGQQGRGPENHSGTPDRHAGQTPENPFQQGHGAMRSIPGMEEQLNNHHPDTPAGTGLDLLA